MYLDTNSFLLNTSTNFTSLKILVENKYVRKKMCQIANVHTHTHTHTQEPSFLLICFFWTLMQKHELFVWAGLGIKSAADTGLQCFAWLSASS